MIRTVPALLLLGWLLPAAAPAQTVRFGLQGVGVTYSEINQGRRAEGGGVGGTFSLRWRRFLLDASGMKARMNPKGSAGGPSFDLLEGDVRLSYAFAPGFAVEVGGGRRAVTPEFATQSVGVVRLGLWSEIALNRISSIWARGAYLVNSRFDGGGSANLAVELGLGASVGTANGRFRGRTDFEFQRIDRKVGTAAVPLEMAVGKLGLEIGF